MYLHIYLFIHYTSKEVNVDKHYLKVMDNEIHDLRNHVYYLNNILINIKDWLEDESQHSECATSLVKLIKKWESEDE